MALQTPVASSLGRRTSIVRNQAFTPGAAGTVDTLHILHGLGVSPDVIDARLRTLDDNSTLGAPVITVVSWDATRATVEIRQTTNSAASGRLDVICQALHSFTL